ncbi:hypothetical protein, partial [Anaerocolumna xylanovorans]
LTALYFDENGKAMGMAVASTSNVYAPGYTDTVVLKYPIKSQTWNSSTGQYDYTYNKPVSYLIYTNGAYVTSN